MQCRITNHKSLPFVCTSVYESTMFASAFNLCFFGLLRVGEITSQSKGRAGKHVIHISDIKLVHKQDSVDLHLMIRSSKTDQHSHSTTLIICSQTDNSIRPVHLLEGYLEVRQHALDSNLYLHFVGSDLTRYQFSIVADKFYVGYVYDVLPGSTFTLTSYFTNAEKSEKTQTERACEHSGFIY
jgi:hypothetical protein